MKIKNRTKVNIYSKELFFIFGLALIFSFFYLKPFSKELPLFLLNQKTFFNFSLPEYFFYSQEFQKGSFPLWNPFKGGGSPVIGEIYHGIFNPLNILILKIFPFPLNLKILYFFYFLISALGILLFLKTLNVYRTIVFWGVIFYSLSGFFLSFLGNIFYFQQISLIPLTFFFAHKLVSNLSFKNAFLLGLIFAFQGFSGNIFFPLVNFLIIFIYFLLLSLSSRKNQFNLKKVLTLFISLVIFLTLTAVKWLPLKNSLFSFQKPLAYFFSVSYPENLLSSFFNPKLNIDFSLYTGFFFIFPYFLLITHNKRELKKINKILLISLAGIFLSFLMLIPKKSPLYIFYLFFPFNFLENPLIFSSFMVWFLVISSCLIFNFLFSKRKLLITVFLFLNIGELLIFSFYHLPKETVEQKIKIISNTYPFLEKIKKENASIIFIESPNNQNSFVPLQLKNNIFWEIKTIDNDFYPTKRYKVFINYLYGGIEYRKDLKEFFVSERTLNLLRLWGVKYLVSLEKVNNLKNFTNQNSLYFYQLKNPLEAKIKEVQRIREAELSKEALNTLSSANFNALNEVIVEKIPKTNPENVLVITQNYYPGWKIFLANGGVKESIPVNFNQFGVLDVKEKDILKISFFPPELKTGIIISFTGIIFFLIIFLFQKIFFFKSFKFKI